MLMLMHRLNTTIDVNVKEILPKRLLKVQDEEFASQNKKTVAEIKNLEWNSETKVTTIVLYYEFITVYIFYNKKLFYKLTKLCIIGLDGNMQCQNH